MISDAIASGKLTATPDWYKCRIQAPAELTIDAGREASQEREDVQAGLMTMREHFGKRGMDWQSECQQKAKEMKYILEKAQDIADDTGVDFETIVNLMTKGEFTGSAPVQEEEEDESDTLDKDATD